MSSEALAVLFGVIVGVAVSLPTVLIVMWFFTRKKDAPPPAPPELQIIFVASPASSPQLPAPQISAASLPAPASARRFIVIGDDTATM